jgi:hypothetical protein
MKLPLECVLRLVKGVSRAHDVAGLVGVVRDKSLRTQERPQLLK